ncbi:MAG: hypothetical protein MSG64_15750 [Pyrinomonadaceae bacterium MAG19_C2-C3]|nr:hypothetical protein [Pyrinomonadaceae bacterium MAG19_C2-C3]
MLDSSNDAEGWGSWRRHVLMQMDEQGKDLKALAKDISNINTQIELLKFKSSLWGAAGAGLVVLIFVLVEVVKKKVGG